MTDTDHKAGEAESGARAPGAAGLSAPAPARRASHGWIVTGCLAFIAAMVGLTYASVPLYAMFCTLTGFGGATRVAEGAPGAAPGSDHRITVSFDANVAPGLAWSFAPKQRDMTVEIGASSLAYYEAKNLAAAETHGNAAYNVSPPQAGAYFVKMQCFCFEEQVLAAGETMPMPVAFYIDPAILEDPDLKSLTTITLSYTFFPAKAGARAEAPGTKGKPL